MENYFVKVDRILVEIKELSLPFKVHVYTYINTLSIYHIHKVHGICKSLDHRMSEEKRRIHA